MILDPYSASVRKLFADTAHAGDLEGSFGGIARGAAAESVNGARIEFVAGTNGAKLEKLRYRATGCPHFIAAAEWLCRQFEGGEIAELDIFDVQQCMSALDIPVAKTGRVLLIEDAIHLLLIDTRKAGQV